MKKAWLLCVLALAFVLPATTTSASTSCTAAIPDASVTGDLLLAVTGPPDHATAVGVHYIGGDGTPLVTRWAGGAWHRIRVPVTPGAVLIQFQAATTAGARAWAVGAFRNDRPEAGFVVDGRWHWTHPIDPGPEEDEFLGVAAAPDGTVWAVGKHQVGADYQPLIERWDASGWHVVTAPSVHGSSVLNTSESVCTGCRCAKVCMPDWLTRNRCIILPWSGTTGEKIARKLAVSRTFNRNVRCDASTANAGSAFGDANMKRR